MTDPTPTGPESPVDGPEADLATEDTGEHLDDLDDREVLHEGELHPDDAPTSREAAKWRRKFRDTDQQLQAAQAEHDTALAAMQAEHGDALTAMQDRVEALQRAHAERLLDKLGLAPKALWAVTELADVLDEAGVPDEGKVEDAAAVARQQLGISRAPAGFRSGASRVAEEPRPNQWRSAFAPPDRE
ncbi:hypothetical protein [Mycolicibacterium pyrenivorans]|uniref:hypothetical protein n=1 Tax=Mycolicibacterium pyrenivorans TaxID=187102 RepID=UPI0021F383EE|nr:hypothetical protein [Mycolicibacterium pyrenivorans]MCV7150531.1 hypothetical protein [Mycolicibacterium pyrenivorans]